MIATSALITVFRDNYEPARPCAIYPAYALCRSSSHVPLLLRTRERAYFGERRGEERKEERRGEIGRAGTRDRVYVERQGACARATDVSKAADAVFVMLMLSLLTVQRGPLLLPRARDKCVLSFSPFARNAVSIFFFLFSRALFLCSALSKQLGESNQ